MARKFSPAGGGKATPRMKSVTGETFGEAQKRHRGGVRSRGVFNKSDPAGPERSFDSKTLQAMATDAVLASYAYNERVNPFELNLNRQGLDDWIEFFDAYDDSSFQPQTTPGPKSNAVSDTAAPAPMSLIPTSTINPTRPRTVAAGYEFNPGSIDTGKLSVIFRDGTYYNYYDVPEKVWEAFKAAPSKGRFIKSILDSYDHGYADSSSIPVGAAVHKAARVAQQTLHAKHPRKSGKSTVQVARQMRRKTRR